MAEYIERQAEMDALKQQADIMRTWVERYAEQRVGILTAVNIIEDIEPADVVQVVHGKWIDEDPAFAEYFANCSVCGYEIDVHNERGYFNFCPNCGAKMDGKKDG